jgi:hypothetical protein
MAHRAVLSDAAWKGETPIEPSSAGASLSQRAITARAVLIGLLCVIGIAVAGCYSAFLRYDLIGTGHLPRSALWPVLVMVGFNAIHSARRSFGYVQVGFLFVYLLTIFFQCYNAHLPWLALPLCGTLVVLLALKELPQLKFARLSGWVFWLGSVMVGMSARAGALPMVMWIPVVALVGLHVFLLGVRKSFALSRRELLTIYCMLLVTSSIPGQQFATYFYMEMVGPVYYASPQNRHYDLFLKYFRTRIPGLEDWLVPTLDSDAPIVRQAFEGIPKGGTVPYPDWARGLKSLEDNAPSFLKPAAAWLPYYAWWVKPILFWTPLVIGIFWVTICFSALLRRQWVEHERLLFPLAEVPLEVTATPSGFPVGAPLFKNWLFWLFFAIPVVIHSLNAMHFYSDRWPEIDLKPSTQNMFSDRPWTTFNWTTLSIYFYMIGITYLLTTEMGFSWWFFWVARKWNIFFRTMFGLEDHGAVMQQYSIGAFIALIVFYLYVMRGHLWDVIRKAFGKASHVDDSQEPLSYRLTLFGLIVGLVIIFAWCWAIGMPLEHALLLWTAYFGGILVLTRMVSEAGLFVFWLPIAPQGMVVSALGNVDLPARSLTAMSLVGWKIQDSASNIMPNALQGFKIGGETGMNQRRLFFWMFAAIVVAVFACHIPSIYIFYTYTVPHMGWWPKGTSRAVSNQIIDFMVRPQEFRSGEWGNVGAGVLFCSFLLLMRQKFLWWPFHPLGFAGAFGTWFGDRYGFSMFLGWLGKVIVLKAGGAKAWRACRPAALGLIIGDTFILFLWLLLQLIWSPGDKVLIIE